MLKTGGGTNWEPIGSATHPFFGTFDGREHKILNLVNTSEASELGLFGYASQWEGSNGGQVVTATIKNLTIENVTLKGDAHVGGVVGTLVYGSIENVSVIGNIHVEAKTHAAGVVGLCYGELKDVHVDGANGVAAVDGEPSWNIHATVKIAGGIVGGYAGATLSDLSAEHISVFVDGVNAENPESTDVGYAGGIAGVVVEQAVEASGLEVRDVKVGAGATNETEAQQQAAANKAGALVGSVVAGGLTLESYYVSTDSEIVDENQEIVNKTEGGEDVPEVGNEAPVVGGSFTVPADSVIWLDEQNGMTVAYKGPKGDKEQSTALYIEIYDENGLKAWNELVNGADAAKWLGVDVHIKSDITLAANDAGNWTPVGTEDTPFTGNFDGEGHTIDGIHVVNLDREFAGFFGVVDGNVIENTSFANSMIDNKYNDGKVAVVAGRVMGATTLNGLVVKDSCVVSSEKVGGGLVGYVKDDEKWGEGDLSAADAPKVLITNCTNYASVTAKEKVGGIVGHIQHSNVTFSHCVNHGNLTATGNSDKKVETNAGGMVAYVMRSAKTVVEYCSNYGTISATACGAMTSSKLNVGGIIGTTHQGDFEFTEVANYGEIIATAEPGAKIQPKVGGIVGSSSQSDKMNGVISKGNITCTTNDTQRAVAGGIMGWEDGGSLTVTNAEIDCTITAINKGEAVGVALAGSVVAFVTKSAPVSISDVKISVTINPVNESTYTILGGTDSKDYAVSLTNTTLSLVYASDEEGEAGFTQDFAWDAEGAVTVGDYHIYNLAGLKAFRDSVNAGNNYKSATILLEAGFDLGGEEDPWAPIGFSNSEASATFAGTFDGQGYTLTNLYITNLAPENHNNQHLGLFGRVESATICNLTIENAYVFHNDGSNCVAVVVGESFPGAHISDVVVKGTVVVKGGQYTGVIIGKGYVNVENCRVEANDGSYVENYWQYAGGIAGWLGEGSSSISGCYTNIDIRVTKAGYSAIGAVSGIAQANNVIENCIIDGVTLTVERVFSGDDEDSNGVGAIAGRGANNVTLRGNSGEVTVIADKSVRLNYYGLIGNAKQNIPLTGLTLENNDLKINWNNQYSYDDNVWTLGEGADLARALESAKEGETYVLGADHYTLSAKVSVENVVIEGVEGTVIDVNPSEGKKTDITGNNVTLKGMTFKAEIGTNNSGSAVQVHGDNFTLEDCTFDVSGTNYVSVQILSGAENVTIKGCHFNGGFKAIGSSYGTKGTTITIDHCTIENGTYGVHFDQTNGAKIVIKDCEIGAWTSFGSTGGGKVEVYNTHFKDGGSYNFFRPYVDTLLDNCTFDGGFQYDAGKAGITITVKNPTFTEEGKDMKNLIGNHTKFTLVVDGEVNRMFED